MVARIRKIILITPLISFLCLFLSYAFAIVLLQLYGVAPVVAAQTENAEFGNLSALKTALSDYRQIGNNGGWPKVSEGPNLRRGCQDERVFYLKQRLVASGDLSVKEDQGSIFDLTLQKSVRRFQARHGLKPDGIVGIKTLKELNVPIEERIGQLEANIERCGLPKPSEDNYILVNIADYTLKVFENDVAIISMPVIIGKTDRKTPVLSGRVSYLVLNPDWNVPVNIFSEDILPEIIKDPQYIQKLNLRFLDWGTYKEINPATIDWESFISEEEPFLIRQDPGPANPMGLVKFYFANPYEIYLHDTPNKDLFKEDIRAFSSGCVRLEKPLELAAYLMQGTPLDSVQVLSSEISKGYTQKFVTPSYLAIYIVYITAWVDYEGIINFRPDIYELDSPSSDHSCKDMEILP